MARSRAWCFTLNNYTEEEDNALQALECVYLIYGYETAPETGTPHLQGYVRFKNDNSLEQVKTKIPRAHLERSRGSCEDNVAYCKKTREGDTPNEKVFEKGTRPLSPKEKGEGEKRKWQDIIKHAKAGDEEWLEANHPQVLLRYDKAIERLAAKHRKVEPLVHRKVHTWIWGVTDSGKTHHALHMDDLVTRHPSLYTKKADKWWCQYKDEQRVVIMEWAPKHYQLSEDLKEWADKWPFRAEGKGTSMLIRPKEIWVCSNYSIEQCFSDPETVKALLTRFNVVYLANAYVPPETVGFDF